MTLRRKSDGGHTSRTVPTPTLVEIEQTLDRRKNELRFVPSLEAVILPDADEHEAIQIDERIRVAIEAVGLPGAQGQTVTISASAAAIRGGDRLHLTLADLIASADEGLYQAKRLGRNRVVSSVQAMHPI